MIIIFFYEVIFYSYLDTTRCHGTPSTDQPVSCPRSPQGAGHEQVRAAHPGRDGNTGKVSASAYLDVGLSEYCLKSLDANLYQVIFLREILLECNYRQKYEIISQICLQKLNYEYNRR